MPNLIAKYGIQEAVEISKFEISHIQVIKDLIEKEGIDCEFTLTRSMDVFLDEEPALECKKAFDLLMAYGFTSVKEVQFTPAKYAEGVRMSVVFIQN